jgi:hypothetical protein
MTDQLTATPVIKNKFWVVESRGQQVGSIQARDDGGFAYVHDQQREYFPSIRAIKNKHNIQILTKKSAEPKRISNKEIYGYPCHKTPHSEVFDVRRQLPIYSLNDKSKSFYCAGYYLVKFGNEWLIEFCPKLIVINRYPFSGPYRTREQAQGAAVEKKETK